MSTSALAAQTTAKTAAAAASFAIRVTLSVPALPAATTTPMLQLAARLPVRVPALRSGRTTNHNRAQNVEAELAQAMGQVNVPCCDHCNLSPKPAGPWTLCVSVAGFLSGSCANCHYGSEGSRCSLRRVVSAPPAALANVPAPAATSAGPTRPRRAIPPRPTAAAAATAATPCRIALPAASSSPSQRRSLRAVAPGNRISRPTVVLRRSPSERARHFAVLYTELAALYEEEAEALEGGEGVEYIEEDEDAE